MIMPVGTVARANSSALVLRTPEGMIHPGHTPIHLSMDSVQWIELNAKFLFYPPVQLVQATPSAVSTSGNTQVCVVAVA